MSKTQILGMPSVKNHSTRFQSHETLPEKVKLSVRKIVVPTLLGVLLLAIGLVIYLATLKGVPGNPKPSDFKNNLDQATQPLELSPERGRYAEVMSIVQDHRFNLSQTLANAVYPDVGVYQGHYFIYFAPGISLATAPFYMIGERYNLAQVFSFSLSIVAALGAELFLFLIARRIFQLPVSASILAAVIYAFGSTSWSYAVTLYQHQMSTFLLLSAFYAAWLFRQRSRWSWLAALWVWCAFAYGLLIDYPNGLFFLPIMVYFFFSAVSFEKVRSHLRISLRLTFFVAAIGFALISLWHAYYNQTNYGSWHSLSGTLVGVKEIEEQNIAKNAQAQQLLANAKTVESFFAENKIIFGFYTLMFSPDRGIFFYSPIFLLALLGIPIILKQRQAEVATLFATAMCIIFLYSSWGDPWGGWGFGPRYLIPTMPIFSLLVVYWVYQHKWQLYRKLLLVPLFAFSMGVSLLGVLTTNAIPPKVEADALHTGYNYLRSITFFQKGQSSSFLYNAVFHRSLSLGQYYALIYVFVFGLFLSFLFVVPIWEEHDN